MDIVDIIVENTRYDRGNKLIKLYAVIMLNYRSSLGDKAWSAIDELFFNDKSLTSAFSFLTGFCSGQSISSSSSSLSSSSSSSSSSSRNFNNEKFEKFISADIKEYEQLTKI